jgi:hypothetical protein
MTAVTPTRRAPRDGGDGAPVPADARARFGLLLVVLIVTYLLSAFTLSNVAQGIEIVLFLAALLLALRTSGLTRRWRVLVGVVAITGTLAGPGRHAGNHPSRVMPAP